MNKYLYKKIIEQYGDAFYLLDSNKFRKNFLELKNSFSSIYPNFNIAYSYKTNYIPRLCKIVNELDGYAEVVSDMELELAKRIGSKHEQIIWNGPIKNEKIVEDYLISGGLLNVDNIEEFNEIKKVFSKYKEKEFRIGIRCNFDVNDGVISRFGFDIESKDFEDIIEYFKTNNNIKLVSLQCHFAKRNLEYWKNKTKGMLDLLDRLELIPEIVDIGGGLFGKMEDSLKKQFDVEIPTYEEYAKVIAGAFAEKFGNCKEKPLLLIEPGSALVGDCMSFVGTIKSIKNIRGKYFASVLASQKNISMVNVNPPIEIIHMSNPLKKYNNLDFVGFTCIESDVLYRNYCGELAVGDLLVLNNCGSYSIVMKPPFILPNFPVLDICDDNVEVIKKAESFEDIFNTYIM